MDNQVHQSYSLADVAKITRKSEKTIARWIKSGKLPATKHGTGYLILMSDIPLEPEEGEDCAWDLTTRLQQRLKTWSPDQTQNDDAAVVTVSERLPETRSRTMDGPLDVVSLLRHQKDEIEKIIREQNELAEKYARATYTLGQLEERNRQLDETNQKLEQKLLLLPQPEQWSHTTNLLNELKEQKKQKEIDLAEEERKNKDLAEEKMKLAEKIKSLPEPDEWQKAQKELALLKNQLQQKSADATSKEREWAAKVKILEKEKEDIQENYRRKTFFQRLFGQ